MPSETKMLHRKPTLHKNEFFKFTPKYKNKAHHF